MRNVPASPSGRHEKTSGAAKSSSRELRSLPSLCGSGSFHTKTSSLLDRFYQGKTIPMCSKQVTVTAATAFAFALAFGLPWDLVEETGFFLGFLGAVAFSVETSGSIHSASSSSSSLSMKNSASDRLSLGAAATASFWATATTAAWASESFFARTRRKPDDEADTSADPAAGGSETLASCEPLGCCRSSAAAGALFFSSRQHVVDDVLLGGTAFANGSPVGPTVRLDASPIRCELPDVAVASIKEVAVGKLRKVNPALLRLQFAQACLQLARLNHTIAAHSEQALHQRHSTSLTQGIKGGCRFPSAGRGETVQAEQTRQVSGPQLIESILEGFHQVANCHRRVRCEARASRHDGWARRERAQARADLCVLCLVGNPLNPLLQSFVCRRFAVWSLWVSPGTACSLFGPSTGCPEKSRLRPQHEPCGSKTERK